MPMTATAIRDALAARGIDLSDAAEEHDLQRFEAELNVSLNAYVQHLYRTFNGFSSTDPGSQIRFWSLQEVAENRELCMEVGGQRYFPVGDFLIHSDFVMLPLERESSPVIYLYERRQLAANTPEFFEKLIAGAFDFR
jgi:hypothetical protein